MLQASEFHKKHHINGKYLKKDFSIIWQQTKEIIRECSTWFLYSQAPLSAESNPKDTQRNENWQMDMFNFAELGKLKYLQQHIIDTYSGFQGGNCFKF